jgi:hypothetical protein
MYLLAYLVILLVPNFPSENAAYICSCFPVVFRHRASTMLVEVVLIFMLMGLYLHVFVPINGSCLWYLY